MLYLSKSRGIGGHVKSSPEDFTVMEILGNGTVLEPDKAYSPADIGEAGDDKGKFAKFVMQKRDWDTVQALIKIAKIAGRGRKSISYAGSKDRQSISTQLASIFGADPSSLIGIRARDIKITCAWRSSTPVELGSNIGNSFVATIRECSNTERLAGIIEELSGSIPNYFDKQRFGMRMNNSDIGLCIMRGEFEEAVTKFLTDSNLESNVISVEARKRLSDEMDFKSALQYFPKNLRNERTVIEYLSRYDNYANALRKLPRGILLMFVHSVQSLIFNNALQDRIEAEDLDSHIRCKKNFYGFPDIGTVGREGDFALGSIVGYATKDEAISDYEKEQMEKIGIAREDFKVKGIPELGSKGSFRVILAPVKNVSHESEGNNATIKFSLPSGSYATIFLYELTKTSVQ